MVNSRNKNSSEKHQFVCSGTIIVKYRKDDDSFDADLQQMVAKMQALCKNVQPFKSKNCNVQQVDSQSSESTLTPSEKTPTSHVLLSTEIVGDDSRRVTKCHDNADIKYESVEVEKNRQNIHPELSETVVSVTCTASAVRRPDGRDKDGNADDNAESDLNRNVIDKKRTVSSDNAPNEKTQSAGTNQQRLNKVKDRDSPVAELVDHSVHDEYVSTSKLSTGAAFPANFVKNNPKLTRCNQNRPIVCEPDLLQQHSYPTVNPTPLQPNLTDAEKMEFSTGEMSQMLDGDFMPTNRDYLATIVEELPEELEQYRSIFEAVIEEDNGGSMSHEKAVKLPDVYVDINTITGNNSEIDSPNSSETSTSSVPSRLSLMEMRKIKETSFGLRRA